MTDQLNKFSITSRYHYNHTVGEMTENLESVLYSLAFPGRVGLNSPIDIRPELRIERSRLPSGLTPLGGKKLCWYFSHPPRTPSWICIAEADGPNRIFVCHEISYAHSSLTGNSIEPHSVEI